jgi:hypothetical protein
VEIKEPLFGLDSGMSTYNAQNIFYPRFWRDILVQDVDYQFGKTDTNALFNSRSEYVRLNGTAINSGLEWKDPTNTKLTVRSRDGLDQRNKQLARVDQRYPLMYPYRKIIEYPSIAEFSLYFERGVPDYFFVFAETQFTTKGIHIPTQNPVVSSINFFARVDKHKSLCSYLLDQDELWNATRRNSHPMVDLDELREIGGVLINRADIGTLERDEFTRQDCLDMTIEVGLDISALSTTIRTMPIKVTLVAIWEDKLMFQGQNGTMSFFEEPREYLVKQSY